MEKTIAVLGATGSVGQQALEVAASRGYRVDYLTAASSVGAMENLALAFASAWVAKRREGSE